MKNQEAFMRKTIVVWLGAMICCALWGSAFPFIKIGYRLFAIPAKETGTQILFAGMRFTLAGILTIILGSLLSGKMLIPKKESLPRIFKLCLLQTVIQYVFFYVGLANASGVKASIIESVNVFAAIFIASLLFHQEKLTARKVMGSLIGFAGVVLVNLNGGSLDASFQLLGEGAIMLSAVAYAFSSVFIKIYSRDENPVVLSGYQFMMGGVIMVGIGLLMGGKLTTTSGPAIGVLVYLAMVSAVAYSLWGILLKYNPVSRVSIFGFMNPVFGVILSAILLREGDTLGVTCLISLMLVSLGIYIVNKN
ncbi:MAG: DMT family transporter [Lachnospiraceae bacterium]